MTKNDDWFKGALHARPDVKIMDAEFRTLAMFVPEDVADRIIADHAAVDSLKADLEEAVAFCNELEQALWAKQRPAVEAPMQRLRKWLGVHGIAKSRTKYPSPGSEQGVGTQDDDT